MGILLEGRFATRQALLMIFHEMDGHYFGMPSGGQAHRLNVAHFELVVREMSWRSLGVLAWRSV